MIHIFLRQTNHNRNLKNRPSWFNYEKVFVNLLKTIDYSKCKLTIMFDGDSKNHFTNKYISEYDFKIIEMKSGSETQSFFDTCRYILDSNIDSNDIVYLVENDYLHKNNWVDIITELFNFENMDHYATLYDHNDKYNLSIYDNLESKILTTGNSHWRTTPSTTGTFFVRYHVFVDDYNIHSSVVGDHNKFTNELYKKNRLVLSSIPGYSTHCECNLMSPFINWEEIHG